jgi:MFS family permease
MAIMGHEATGLEGSTLNRARERTRYVLAGTVALGSTGHIAAITISTIVAKDLLGSGTFAGVPGAGVVLGAAAGAVVLSSLMTRRGRRFGLTSGYVVSVVGALIATSAVLLGSFPLLLPGMFLIGFGNSSNQLSRYAAGDLVPPSRRAVAIGFVVWGGTVGAVIGPWLVPIAGRFVADLGLPANAGPLLIPVLFVGLAAVFSFLLLRPDPYALADSSVVGRPDDPLAAPIRTVLRRPSVLAAIVALVAGQFTMVLVMTYTPLHLTGAGHGLEIVGIVLSAHVIGMFALAPVSGRIAQRLGSVRTIFLGESVLVVGSLLAAFSPDADATILTIALFLLGFGWNLGFVAGSALLSSGLEIAERTRVQGLADAVIWSTSAFASLGSGLIVAAATYTGLGIIGAVLVAIPAWFLLMRRKAIALAATT